MTERLAMLVTGSRYWTDRTVIHHAMDEASKGYKASNVFLIEGDATGADAISKLYAKSQGFNHIPMPAQWDRHSSQAGPKRNVWELALLEALRECGYDTIVLGFPLPPPPGKRGGTQSCMQMAIHMDFKVENHGVLK